MNNKLNKLLVASSLSLFLAGTNTAALAQPDSLEIKNARQESQIETTFALSPYLRAQDINVVVENDKATLTGIVDEKINKELAHQIALGVPGIASVDNNIEVKTDYAGKSRTDNERSFGDIVDDASVTAAVKSKLLWNTYTDGMDIKVETYNGEVTLTGTADSETAKVMANMLATDTRGVRSVNNQLTIAAAESRRDDSSNTGQAISDTWITTKVKSTYLMSSNIHSKDISVTTEDGVVILSGTAHSDRERALAIELARNIKGVKNVKATTLKF